MFVLLLLIVYQLLIYVVFYFSVEKINDKMSTGDIEKWFFKMGYRSKDSTKLKSVVHKINEDKYIKLYFDKLIQHIKPKAEVRNINRCYIYVSLKNGKFGLEIPFRYNVKNSRDVEHYKKFGDCENKILALREVLLPYNLNDITSLKSTVKSIENEFQVQSNKLMKFTFIDNYLTKTLALSKKLDSTVVSSTKCLLSIKNGYLSDSIKQNSDFISEKFKMNCSYFIGLKNEEMNLMLNNHLIKLKDNISELKNDIDQYDFDQIYTSIDITTVKTNNFTDDQNKVKKEISIALNKVLSFIRIKLESIKNNLSFNIKPTSEKIICDNVKSCEQIKISLNTLNNDCVAFTEKLQGFINDMKDLFQTDNRDKTIDLSEKSEKINKILNRWATSIDSTDVFKILSEKKELLNLFEEIIASNDILLSCTESKDLNLETDQRSMLNVSVKELLLTKDILKQTYDTSVDINKCLCRTISKINFLKINGIPCHNLCARLKKAIVDFKFLLSVKI